MDKFRFFDLVKDPSLGTVEDEISLVEITETFPYCQSAFVILAKSSHHKGGMHADTNLHAAAIRIPHREHLRKLLQAENTLKNLAYISAEKKNTEKFKNTNVNISVMDSIDKKNNSLLEELEVNLRNLQALKKNAHFFDNFKIEKEIFIDEPVAAIKPAVAINLNFSQNDDLDSQYLPILVDEPAEITELAINSEIIIPEIVGETILSEDQAINETIENIEPLPDLINVSEELNVLNAVDLAPTSEEVLLSTDLSSTNIELFHYEYAEKFALNNFKNLRVEDTEMNIKLTGDNPIDVLLSYIDYLDKRRNGEEFDYIDQFIQNEPVLAKFSPNEIKDTPIIDLASESSAISDELITENLANIFLKQNRKEKALEIYNKLSLKNPEKSAYFASKILEIENS